MRVSPPSFLILMIGQTIASFSSPISLNITTMVCTIQFKTEKLRMSRISPNPSRISKIDFSSFNDCSLQFYGLRKIEEQQLACSSVRLLMYFDLA